MVLCTYITCKCLYSDIEHILSYVYMYVHLKIRVFGIPVLPNYVFVFEFCVVKRRNLMKLMVTVNYLKQGMNMQL